MALKTHTGIRLRHAAAIVDDLYECFAGIPNDQFNLCSACIHRIFKQFFHNGGGALYDLACRYLVGYTVG